MTSRQWSLAGIFILTIVLAFTLRNAVEAAIIIPIAYIWWLLKLYYAALPQFIFWLILTAFVFYSAIITIIPKIHFRTRHKVETKPAQGQIETLTDWLNKSQRGGTYYKWLIANRLGKSAREILAQREGRNFISKKFGALTGRGWNPPREINTYLDIGLNGSFANLPRRGWLLRGQDPLPTTLDVDTQQVIDYLEDEMEI